MALDPLVCMQLTEVVVAYQVICVLLVILPLAIMVRLLSALNALVLQLE